MLSLRRVSRTFIAIWAISLVFFVSGCARSLPLISHAHIGHTLTAWRDTPQEQGLFAVAEKETQTALEQIKLVSTDDPSSERQSLKNIIHALNPDVVSSGSALGYGAIRALQGSVDHLRFAATTDDASGNVMRHAQRFTESGDALLDRFQIALKVAELALDADETELPGLTGELESLLQQCANGSDADGDGSIDNSPEEAGLVQLRQQLSSMIRKEKNPPYHPLGRKYLLGLIRLPNGTWAYKFNRSASLSSGSSSGGGY